MSGRELQFQPLKFIDLFAGIGGFHYGLHDLGLQCVFASELDRKARETYKHNFKQISPQLFTGETQPLFNQDITQQDFNLIPDHDVLCGGFPCQPFSIAGYRKGLKDQGRGDLFFTILEIIRRKKPAVIFLENVKNLLSHAQGKTYNYMKTLISEEGYYVTEKVLNTMTYGNLPQNRERLYILGFKSKIAYSHFAFPQPVPLTTEFRSMLENKEIDDYFYYNNKPLYERLKKEVVKTNTVYQWRRVYVRENKRGVCPTLTANMGTGGHNVPIIKDEKGIRKLTPLECLRLQGFPKEFTFPENLSRGNQYKQVGNAVSVSVVKSIAQQIKLQCIN